MIRTQPKIDAQVQFWALLGPIITLLTVVLLLVKSSGDWSMPVIGISGVLICWRWKILGLAASTAMLFIWFLFQSFYLQSPEVYWNIGIATSLTLSFIVTALSFEEVSSLLAPLQQDVQGKLESLWQLDDQLKASQEKEKTYENQVALSELALTAARDEVLHLTLSQEQLMRDLFEARTSANRLTEEQELIQAELSRLRVLLRQAEGSADLQAELSEKKKELARLENTYSKLAEQEVAQQALMLEMSDHIETLTKEKAFFEEHLASLQKDYQVLQEQKLAPLPQQQQQQPLPNQYQHQIDELKSQLQNALYQQGEYQSKIVNLRLLSDQCLDLQMRNENLVRERDALKRELEAGQEIPRDARIANGKYTQLREQFDAKCAELDAARKIIFQTQEQLEAAKLEQQERSLQDNNDLVVAKVLAQAEREIAALEAAHQQEIADLKQSLASS